MNNINTKQNSEELLNLLKLQRYKYNKVSKISTLNFILSVITPIVISLIGLFNIPNNVVSYINYIGAVCVIICLWLSTRIKTIKEKAATVQYLFDVKLFGFKTNSFICNNTTEILALSKDKRIQKLKGLENWYSIKDNLDMNTAIFSCQQQNIRWDSKLRKIYLFCIVTICFISIFTIVSIGILKNLQLNTLWTYVFLLIPIISYCVSLFFSTIDNIRQQKELNNICSTYKTKKDITTKELISFEEKIFYYRKDLIKIPNWFFNIFKRSMQKEADEYSEVESEIYSKTKSKF